MYGAAVFALIRSWLRRDHGDWDEDEDSGIPDWLDDEWDEDD